MRSITRVSRHGLWAAFLLAVLAAGALAQRGMAPYVPGEVIVWARPGAATQDDVRNLAAAANATLVRPLRMQDLYLLRVRGVANAVPTDEAVTTALTSLTASDKFRWVGTNRYFRYLDSIPNDPRYNEQWALPMMRMPQAWDIEKGKDTVTAVVMDSGCDVAHPDLKDRIVGGQNFGDPTKATDLSDPVPHGTHVTGIIGASTNNGVGVAGITWQGVKLYIAKVSDSTGAPSYSAAVDAIAYVRSTLNKGGTRVVVNFSIGNDTSSDDADDFPPLTTAMLGAASEGVVFTIAAGNSFDTGNPPDYPANLAARSPLIFNVASVGPTKRHAYYSTSRPTTTIAAPGGDQSLALSDGILSTLPNNTYAFEQGTSMAAPACAGAVAILLSAGAEPGQVKDILTGSADKLGMGVPNSDYGFGVVDVFAALQNIMSVTVVSPAGTGGKASGQVGVPPPVETLRPTWAIRVRQLALNQLSVSIDGQPVTLTSSMQSDITTTVTDAKGNKIPTSYLLSFVKDVAPGRHQIDVSGTGGTPAKTVTDTRIVTVTPHLIPAGRAMVSIPFLQTTDQAGSPLTPAQILPYYLGTDFRVARWLPDVGRYAFMNSFGATDPNFIPPAALTPTYQGAPVFPLGLGFWTDVESAKPILTYGQGQTSASVTVPLIGVAAENRTGVSWNMIGDPFPFDVPFNALVVQTPEGMFSISDAVDRHYILPNLYAYDPALGYTYTTLPDGTLREWTGYWVGVTSSSNISLVVPPASLSRAASAAPARPSTPGTGWLVQLGASAGDLRDTYNFVGVSTKASDGYDRNDAPKPPSPSRYVSLAVRHNDWGARSGAYAADVRGPGQKKTWAVAVNTDQPNSNVTVSWSGSASLPRGQKLTIKDEATGQVVDMRARSAYTFNSGSTAGERRFTVTAAPAAGGIVRVTNVIVRPSGGRASGASSIDFTLSSDASYDVKVLASNGRTVATVGSRAAAAGDVHLVWTGKDGAGRSVPAGMYVVHVRASGPDGDSVNVIQPFAVVR